mmetsp:Transcript_53688/g.160736  ORF Transcript_53688/g.160736 Transcript_53688/m.160736 type:complete len:260 (+) Transcript_53688:372-1151(+)
MPIVTRAAIPITMMMNLAKPSRPPPSCTDAAVPSDDSPPTSWISTAPLSSNSSPSSRQSVLPRYGPYFAPPSQESHEESSPPTRPDSLRVPLGHRMASHPKSATCPSIHFFFRQSSLGMPVMRLSVRSMLSLSNFDRVSGILPVSRFDERLMETGLSPTAEFMRKLMGIKPVRALWGRYSSRRCIKSSKDGRGPVSWPEFVPWFPMERYLRLTSLFISDGIWPVKLFSSSMRTWSKSSFPISLGMLPSKELNDRSSLRR